MAADFNDVVTNQEMPWRVVAVNLDAGGDFQLAVTFIDGKKGLFDFEPYLDRGIFKALRDPSFFRQAYVANDTIAWPNSIDIAPERLYTDCKPLATTETS